MSVGKSVVDIYHPSVVVEMHLEAVGKVDIVAATVSFDFDENDSYSDDQPVSNTVDPSIMNDMMIKLFSAKDPEMLIQTGMALKSMKNGS